MSIIITSPGSKSVVNAVLLPETSVEFADKVIVPLACTKSSFDSPSLFIYLK